MPGPHGPLLEKAAKEVLKPLGFRRQGRSRLWLLDCDWWLVAVEFQPSGWTKGSYLNVAAHWLWSPHGFLSFDFVNRVGDFVEFESSDQFALAAYGVAETAAVEAHRLMRLFSSIDATAAELVASAEAQTGRARGSWQQYNAGVAAGISGQCTTAAALLAAITDDRVKPYAEQMAAFAPDTAAFRQAAVSLIARQRQALRLDPIPDLRF